MRMQLWNGMRSLESRSEGGRGRGWDRGALSRSLAAGAALLLVAGGADAVSFTLDVEFDDGLTGAFADVEVEEQGSGLLFEIELRDPLGPDADMHRFYFNLESPVSELRLSSDDDVTTAYVLSVSPPVAGGAGSDFGYGVSFGNGAGRKGNGVLQTATFLIEPIDSALTLDLDAFLDADVSSTSRGVLAVAALHVQGTSLVRGADSETVGGTVPEPSTGLLLMTGLMVAAAGRGRTSP